MQANRYDRAAEAPILNTYVPINFGELYRIGAAQKEAVDQAAKRFDKYNYYIWRVSISFCSRYRKLLQKFYR